MRTEEQILAWLKKHDVAEKVLEAFKYCLEESQGSDTPCECEECKQYLQIKTIEDLIKCNPNELLLVRAFRWNSSKEGLSFWGNLDVKYQYWFFKKYMRILPKEGVIHLLNLTQDTFDDTKEELIKMLEEGENHDIQIQFEGEQILNLYLDYCTETQKTIPHFWYNKKILDEHSIKYMQHEN